jgi:hypothetical protein
VSADNSVPRPAYATRAEALSGWLAAIITDRFLIFTDGK